jgi:hypothetical protein
MCYIGGEMADPNGGRSNALSQENRSRFRDEFSTPELWQQIRRYGSNQSDDWPDYRINPVTKKGWGSSQQTDFMELLMEAFRKQEDERRKPEAVAGKKKEYRGDIDFPNLPSTAGGGYIEVKE